MFSPPFDPYNIETSSCKNDTRHLLKSGENKHIKSENVDTKKT